MNVDVAIVGGGMVGATLAIALHSKGLHTALIDASPQTIIDDPRLIALNYGSIEFFKKLSLFEKLIPHAAPIRQVHVSHKGHFGSTRLDARSLSIPALGYVIPAKNINATLESTLQQSAVVKVRPATVIGLTQDETQVYLTLEGHSTIQAKIVIAADGTHSTVRDLLSIPVEKKEYHQQAIVTTTTLSRSHDDVAYERFINKGAIAMLPLMGPHCATIWSGDREKMMALMQLSDASFLEELQREFGYKLGRFKEISKRFNFPLQYIQAKHRVQGRVILVGNAAQTVHPLAAQGFNLALREVDLLSQQLQNPSLNLKDLESELSPPWLNKQLSDWLNSLFSTDFFPLNRGRQMGMIGMNICGMINRRFSARLAGLL